MSAMRLARGTLHHRAALLLAIASLIWASVAAAQGAPPVGDLPAGEGVLRGQVRSATGAAVVDVDVSLIAFRPDGQQGLRRTRTGPEGRFRFEAIAADPEIAYFVVARDGGVHHSERTAFAAGATTHEVDVRIAPTSANTRRARRGDTDVRFERSCSGLRVTESHTLANRTRSVIFVDETARESNTPILDLEIPEDATELQSPFGAEPLGLVRDGKRVRFWGPLYPGDQKVEFSYTLPAGAETITARWGYPKGARRVRLLADPSVPEVGVDALRERATRELFGRAHRNFEGSWLTDGSEVTLTASLAAAPPLGRIRETQIWIELDDAALEVDERLALAPDAAATRASLLCLDLPPEATDLRFSEATLQLPISRDPSGKLEVRGPLPPGEQVLTLRYNLPSQADGARFARRFGVPMPLLSVLVSDTGVLPVTTRMHRRRPVRRVERNYMHLEAFQIAADETVAVDFTRVAAAQALPDALGIGFAAMVAGGLLAFLGGPLRGRDEGPGDAETQVEALRAERESVYAAIRDLEEDYDTGKLTAEDRDELREGLRQRAVQLLAMEQHGGEAPPAASPAPGGISPEANDAGAPASHDPIAAAAKPSLARPYQHPAGSYGAARSGTESADADANEWRFCPACGGELPESPRFCPHCGERLPDTNGEA